MSQPWGLSGPEFLGFYALGMAVAVAVPGCIRMLITRVPSRGRDRTLDDDELGYLANGRGRAAEVFIIRLLESGAVRVPPGKAEPAAEEIPRPQPQPWARPAFTRSSVPRLSWSALTPWPEL